MIELKRITDCVLIVALAAMAFLFVRDIHDAYVTKAYPLSSCAPSAYHFSQSIKKLVIERKQEIAAAKVGSVTYNKIDEPIQHVLNIFQNPELPTGCEATAATILLQSYGYQADKVRFANALNKAEIESVNGRSYAPHPSEAFIGDPFLSSGFGAYSNVIADTMQMFIDAGKGKHTAVAYAGLKEKDIISFLDNGTPVCVWATISMVPVSDAGGWYLIKDGVYTDEYFEFAGNEHCLVILGYSETSVTVSDPLQGRTSYDRKLFFSRFNDLGGQAVVIEDIKS